MRAMTNATSCCARRASEYTHARVTEIPELAQVLVDVTIPGAAHRSYRCRLCSQAWEEFRIPSAEAPDFRVVKVGWASTDPPAPAKALGPTPAGAPARDDRRASCRRALVFLALGACLFYALWLLPPLATEKAWVARWIVGGLLLALAVQSVFSILRSKRPARRG
jgi:hypothetical protein